MKTHWKKTLNKDYLGSHDLDNGEGDYSEIKATIKRVTLKDVTDPQGNKSKEKIAEFAGNTKPMILNSTACKHIEKFTNSSYLEEWLNVPVQIFVQRGVKAFGDVVDALRLRDFQPETELPELIKGGPKWQGAVQSLKDNGKDSLSVITEYMRLSDANRALLLAEAFPDEA